MAEIESPCVRNCCLDNKDFCLGCFRHLDEITRWRSLTQEQKRQVMDLCADRKAKRHEASLFPPTE